MPLDAAIDPAAEADRPAEAPVRPSAPAKKKASALLGLEPRWVLAAAAAAPWPLWCAVAAFGIPGPHAPRGPWSFWTDGPPAPRMLHGALALSLVLGAMVAWVFRPEGRRLRGWVVSVVGTGALLELLANALTDMGRAERGLADLSDAPRALLVWITGAAIYELAPIVAASARIQRTERRAPGADLLAHGSFLGLALLALAFAPEPRATGALWVVSPWTAAAFALPLAAARSGPRASLRLPSVTGRAGPLLGLAALPWLLALGFAVARADVLAALPHAYRFGTDPRSGVLLVLPALATVFALLAAASLLRAARRARRAPSGRVASADDAGFTLEPPDAEPTWVALDPDARAPEVGATVSLVGARPEPAGAGPFRDGATQWRTRRVWPGEPETLARALHRRAAGWLAWAGVSAFGTVLALLAGAV